MLPTYGDCDKKKHKNERIFEKKNICNTFFKMRLISTIVNLMVFAINTRGNGMYYGENGSSRF